MKKSITLFITLIFIIVSVTIISEILSIYKKITSSSFLFISQNSKIIQNIKAILKNSDINKTSLFFYKPILLSSKDANFRANIQIKPICSINLNDYLKNKNIDSLIEFLADKYNIQDTIFLKNLFLDTIDKDDIERSAYTEIKLQNPKFVNGRINQKNFQQILNYYSKKTNDKSVFLIPWREFFNFKKTQLFKECINKAILNLNEENITKFNIISYDENLSSFLINVDVDYILKNEHKLSILYDLKQKKVIEVEENPIY